MLLSSFLRAKDEYDFLLAFQKSRPKKALPKTGCFFSLRLMRKGYYLILMAKKWDSNITDGIWNKLTENPHFITQSQK